MRERIFCKFRSLIGVGLRGAFMGAFMITAMLLGGDEVFGQEYTDASGEITLKIFTGPWKTGLSPVSNHLTTEASVDTDYVLVGGGAEISPASGNPGALLTASYPNPNLTTWHVASKDHQSPFPHSLRAYAIGLRLAGVSSVELRSSMVFVPQNSGSARHPNAVASLPPGYLLVGGGARANWSGSAGLLLTGSYPNAFQWVASAKDHNVIQTGSVDAFAIGIAGSIPGFGSLGVSHNSVATSTSNGYGTASVLAPTGWALSSVGGRTQWDPSKGRLLTQLFPYLAGDRAGGLAESKDHFVVSAGSTTAYAVSIQKQ